MSQPPADPTVPPEHPATPSPSPEKAARAARLAAALRDNLKRRKALRPAPDKGRN